MSAPIPKKPAPRVLRTPTGQAQIVPFSQYKQLSDDDIEQVQLNALKVLDKLREQVLSGHVLGLAYATVEFHESDPCLSYGWSDGAMMEGMVCHAAIAQLERAFQETWFSSSETVNEE